MATFVRLPFEQANEVNEGVALGLYDTAPPELHLLKDPVVLTPTLDLATCTAAEADFTGYGNITFPAAGPINFDGINGGLSFPWPNFVFTVGSPFVTGNDVVGFYVQDAAGTQLLYAAMFNTPISMQMVGEMLSLNVQANYFGNLSFLVQVNGVDA